MSTSPRVLLRRIEARSCLPPAPSSPDGRYAALPRAAHLRPDVAQLKPGRLHAFKLANPETNPRQEKHELVLDIDDLAVALVPSNGNAFVHLPTALSGVCLGLGIGFSAWFALAAAIREIIDARHILKRLTREHAELRGMMPKEPHTPWDAAKQRTLEAMLLLNRTDRWEQRTRAVFSGGLVATGAAPEIFGYLFSPELLGAAAPAMVGAATVCLTISVPLITVFAAANAGLQGHRAIRAWRDKRYVPMLARQNPWPVEVFDAEKFSYQRLRQIRAHAISTTIGFTGIAIGAPATFFSGGWGLALLIPGIITVAVTNYFEGRKIEYQNPLQYEETLELVTERQILNAMGLAYQEWHSLKALKATKRRDYLAGAHAGPIKRTLTAPWRAVQRWGKPAHSGEPAINTVYRYIGDSLRLRAEFWKHEAGVFEKHYHECDVELSLLLAGAQTKRKQLLEDLAAWQLESQSLAEQPPHVTVTRLCNTLVRHHLFRPFVEHLARDPTMAAAFELERGAEHTITTANLVQRLTLHTELVGHLFELAEPVLFNTLKKWRHSRARELDDLAIERKRAKVKLAENRAVE